MSSLRLAKPLAILATLGAASIACAQLEVPSPQLIQQSEARLSRLAREAKPASHAAYLRKFLNRAARDETGNRELVTAVRVAADVARTGTGDGWLMHYTVPPLSAQMRLPQAYPADGRPNGKLSVVLAQDEYEPASWVVFPLADVEAVQVRVGTLRTASGVALPASALDLTVVKVWYQNGNAWYSYFQDVGSAAVPELLLHDENLIRVDHTQQANYARIKEGNSYREIWLNPPRKVDHGFNPMLPGFADATQLQPVRFQAGQGKQFMLTVHAAPGTPSGTYRGNVALSAAGRKDVQIPLEITVLPFRLPSPRANFNPEREMIVSLMGHYWEHTPIEHPATLARLRNMRRHNLLNPPLYHLGDSPNLQMETAAALYKKVGFATNAIFGVQVSFVGIGRSALSWESLKSVEKQLRAWRAFYDREFPGSDGILSYGDEPDVNWLITHRPLWRLVQAHGFKTALAGYHPTNVNQAGYLLDYHHTAGAPSDKKHTEPWNQLGSYISFYGVQHNGSENPDFVRRQHGLLGYLANYDMVDNYEFAFGPWNDFGTEVYRPMVLAYPTSTGMVDTLAWEGFREAIDDIRYASALRLLIAEAVASGNPDRQTEARKCLLWLAQMDGERVDLDQVRMEIVEKILHLQKLKGASQ